jgi:protein-S-isoprenylcysteine O-methyltransferase Ste14
VNQLARQALVGFAKLIGAFAILLFVPAWTLDFWQAWAYLLVFGGSSALIAVYLWRKDPALLERRVKAGAGAETDAIQRVIQVFATLAFLGVLVVPALDHRFAWSHVPLPVVITGFALVLAGFAAVFLVFRENTFTSATIEIVAGQRVVSSGPYAIVRHPMYAGALVLIFGTPLALGSWWGLVMSALLTLAICWRLLEEERFLSVGLEGYENYRTRVVYRLIPMVW